MADKDIASLFDEGAKPTEPSKPVEKQSDDIGDLFEQGAKQAAPQVQAASEEAPEEPGTLSKAYSFAKELPQSAIDLVPGMKERKESIEAYRASPEYQTTPSDIPGISKGQRDESMHESAQALTEGAGAMGYASEAPFWALANLIPGLAKKGSSMAASVAGLEPAEEQAMQWVKKAGKWSKVPAPEEAGIGQTAIEQGALPTTGGTSGRIKATAGAIDSNYSKLDPLLNKAQEVLDPNLDQTLESIGHLGDKLGNFHYQFQNDISKGAMDQAGVMSDQAEKITNNLLKANKGNIEKAANLDGNLQALNAFKRDLQAQADAAGAYGPRQNKPAAAYLKGMAGVVRQHIEDLANAADPASQLGSQIAETNSNIQKLIDFQDALKANASKTSTASPSDVVKSAIGPGVLATIGYKMGGPAMAMALPVAGTAARMGTEAALGGQTLGTTAKILGAKALIGASKSVSTPVGDIVLRKAPAVASTIGMSNPFSQRMIASDQPLNATNSSKIAATIYNANDESLKKINNDFKQDPSLANITNAMDKYIKSKDPQDLNVATFLILQNKNAIKLLTGEQ